MLLGACSSDRIAQLEKQNKEIRAEFDRQKTLVDLDTQSKCSNAALAFFRRQWSSDKDTALLDYTNHFNKALGKCFILVEWHQNSNTVFKGFAWYNNIQLYDVLENNQYADFAEHHITAVVGTEVKATDSVLRCNVDGAECKTSKEFNEKTRHYMID
jgi:hypothetical protein